MTRAEFEGCSPADVYELLHAWNDREKRWDYRFGLGTTILANANKKADHPGFEMGDFFPRLAGDVEFPDEDELDRKLEEWITAHNAGVKG